MQRASVDLPQPDSPTRPSVSPRAHPRSTPSTARRVADRPRASHGRGTCSDPAAEHEVLREPARTSSSASAQLGATTGSRRASSAHAYVADWRATWMHAVGSRARPAEREARRRAGIVARTDIADGSGQPGGGAARSGGAPGIDARRPWTGRVDVRDRPEQAERVRMPGSLEDGVDGAGLDDLARVHDGDVSGTSARSPRGRARRR